MHFLKVIEYSFQTYMWKIAYELAIMMQMGTISGEQETHI
jgi:hypothetical protein